MFRRVLFVVSLLTLAFVMIAGSTLAQGGGDPVKGKALWEAKNCKSCHGPNGEGKYAGPRAGDGKTAADWIKQVRTPRQNMPAFDEKHITDQEITDMNAYMQTLPKPASFTPVAYTPAADDMPGKVLFNQKRCVACHGADPSGFVKARFTDKGRTVTAADVIKQLRTPAQNMPMFSVTQVSDAEATQIADYYKSLVVAAAPAPTAAPAATAAPATLPTAGGATPWMVWAMLIVLGGLSVLGIGIGLNVLARKRA
jgi:mono/diheme cytochrome c family protein